MCDYELTADQQGLENLDRIDVLPLEESVQTTLINKQQNRCDTKLWSDNELTELHATIDIERNLYKNHVLNRLDATYSPPPPNTVRRWSQAISLLSKGRASEATVNVCHLPSTKVFELYKKLLLNTTLDPHNEIWQVVTEIAQHTNLMKNTEQGELNRLASLRILPQSLTIKRYIKARLSIVVSGQHLTTSNNGINKYFTLQKLRQGRLRFHRVLAKVLLRLQTCSEPIKEVEAHYGPNMRTYCEFLRIILLLNTFVLGCCIVFIVIPQKLYDAGKYILSTEVFEMTNLTSLSHYEVSPDLEIYFLDLLTGMRYMQSSLMFYSTYSNATLQFNSSNSGTSWSYNLPQAYFITMLVLFLLNFILITISMAHSFSKTFLAVFKKSVHKYSQKIFSSWDYAVSNQKTAEQNHFAIFTDLKESISTLRVFKEKKIFLIRRLFVNLLAHLLVILLIMGTSTSQWIILKKSEELGSFSTQRELYKALLVSITIVFLEWIFTWISKLEHYIPSSGWALHIHLIRCFILEMFMVGGFTNYWLSKVKEPCWESLIGREIYRLMVAEIITTMFVLPIIKIVVFYVTKRFGLSSNCYYPYFDISQRVIYTQTLCWLGLIFAPLIAILIIVKTVLQFYLDRLFMRWLNQRSQQYWCDASLQSTYLGLTFLALMGVFITYGYIVTHIQLSACGPFRDYKYIFEVFLDGVLKLHQGHIVWRVLKFCMRPVIVGGVLIILMIMVYLSREKARAYELMTKYLKEILIMEAKDKEVLLNKMANIGKSVEV